MAIFSQYMGATTDSVSRQMTAENLRDLIKVADEKTWTEAFGITHLSIEGNANTIFIVSQVHYGFSNLCWGIFVICVICGFIEPRAEKKKN